MALFVWSSFSHSCCRILHATLEATHKAIVVRGVSLLHPPRRFRNHARTSQFWAELPRGKRDLGTHDVCHLLFRLISADILRRSFAGTTGGYIAKRESSEMTCDRKLHFIRHIRHVVEIARLLPSRSRSRVYTQTAFRCDQHMRGRMHPFAELAMQRPAPSTLERAAREA